jgi:antitoxin ParD1/3/4
MRDTINAMKIELPPDVARFVKKKLDSGEYTSAREFITHALKVYRNVEKWLPSAEDDLRREIQIGLDDIEAGRVSEWRPGEMKERLRQRLKRRKAS